MPSRTFTLLSGLTLFGLCALAACKPAAPPPKADQVDADRATATSPATAAAPAADAPSMPAVSNPMASDKDEVVAAMGKFVGVRSYHAVMKIDGGAQHQATNEIDFVAPDRYRMQMPMGAQFIIGDTMYMQVQGRTMKVPMPAGTLTQWRDPARLSENAATMTVQAQGNEDIDGSTARKYLVHNTQPKPSDVTVWVGPDGLPVQVHASANYQGRNVATTIRYSRFNDPAIRVDPPQ